MYTYVDVEFASLFIREGRRIGSRHVIAEGKESNFVLFDFVLRFSRNWMVDGLGGPFGTGYVFVNIVDYLEMLLSMLPFRTVTHLPKNIAFFEDWLSAIPFGFIEFIKTCRSVRIFSICLWGHRIGWIQL